MKRDNLLTANTCNMYRAASISNDTLTIFHNFKKIWDVSFSTQVVNPHISSIELIDKIFFIAPASNDNIKRSISSNFIN